MVVAVTEIEEWKKMEQDGIGEGQWEMWGDGEFSFGDSEFAVSIKLKEDAPSKHIISA